MFLFLFLSKCSAFIIPRPTFFRNRQGGGFGEFRPLPRSGRKRGKQKRESPYSEIPAHFSPHSGQNPSFTAPYARYAVKKNRLNRKTTSPLPVSG